MLVRSYRTVSPLPAGRTQSAVCFLWHFPASHLDWRKPAPCPAEPRLSSAHLSGPRSSSRLPATDLKCAPSGPEPCTDSADRSSEKGIEDEGDR